MDPDLSPARRGRRLAALGRRGPDGPSGPGGGSGGRMPRAATTSSSSAAGTTAWPAAGTPRRRASGSSCSRPGTWSAAAARRRRSRRRASAQLPLELPGSSTWARSTRPRPRALRRHLSGRRTSSAVFPDGRALGTPRDLDTTVERIARFSGDAGHVPRGRAGLLEVLRDGFIPAMFAPPGPPSGDLAPLEGSATAASA